MLKDGTYFEEDFMDKHHGKGVTKFLFREKFYQGK
jgi:hypothetical protein